MRLLGLPVAALTAALALGAGVTAAAPAAMASPAPGCLWQSLYLLNNWQSAQTNWNTGDPAYCVANGVVYLSGSLKNPSNTGGEFAALPPQALPTSSLYILTYMYSGSTGRLVISAGGQMYAEGSTADSYTSLAGISFPVAGTALSPWDLNQGWQSAQSLYGTGDPSYVVINNIVYWAGSLTTTNTPNQGYYGNNFAPAPGDSPDGCLGFTVSTYAGNVGLLDIYRPSTLYHDRDMAVYDTTPGTGYYAKFTSLAGISYPDAGTAIWQPLNLQNGWGPVPPDDYCKWNQPAPSYYVQDHVVYFTGEIGNTTAANGFVGNLPAAARPLHDLYLLVGPNKYMHISPNGNMWTFGSSLQDTISLANISYQTSS